MIRPVPAIAVDFLMRAEACLLRAYKDSAGVWTIGVGHTGPEVVAGLAITAAQAMIDLRADLAIAAARLAAVVAEAVILSLTDHEYAALLSFVFNLGAQSGWTIWKLLNQRRLDLIPDQIKRFDKARDPKTGALITVPGLDHRRLAEVALWTTPDAVAAAAIVAPVIASLPPSSQTRAADTPPTPQVVTPLHQSGRFIGSCVTAAVTCAAGAAPAIQAASGGVKQVTDTLQPYTDGHPQIGNIVNVLMGLGAALAVATVVMGWIQHQQSKAA
jgi:lysozyme